MESSKIIVCPQHTRATVTVPTSVLDTKTLFNALLDLFGSANHAWRCAAQLNEIFADTLTVKHRVKCRNLGSQQ